MSDQPISTDVKDVPPRGQTVEKDRPAMKLLAILVGVPAVLIVMLLAFLIPTLHSGPANLPLGVSGPAQATEQIAAALAKQSPDAFEVTTYDLAADARDGSVVEQEFEQHAKLLSLVGS